MKSDYNLFIETNIVYVTNVLAKKCMQSGKKKKDYKKEKLIESIIMKQK